MPKFPLSPDDCKDLTERVFHSLSGRTQTDVIFSLYKHIHPHVDRIPENIYLNYTEAMAPIKNFYSFNGVYSPPLLYNSKEYLVCEYRSDNMDQQTWAKEGTSTPIIRYIDDRILYEYNFWIWRRNSLEEKSDELIAHMKAIEAVLTHTEYYRKYFHFFVILVKEDFATTIEGVKLHRKLIDRHTKTVVLVSDVGLVEEKEIFPKVTYSRPVSR